ncbi:MAG: hypothetical protein J3K34DRAFT_74685 [Monoraphidium minutum]|nr:MAG: hypothetical protein J3K34DRAFT_74685 [Monoraphidium minutum]
MTFRRRVWKQIAVIIALLQLAGLARCAPRAAGDELPGANIGGGGPGQDAALPPPPPPPPLPPPPPEEEALDYYHAPGAGDDPPPPLLPLMPPAAPPRPGGGPAAAAAAAAAAPQLAGGEKPAAAFGGPLGARAVPGEGPDPDPDPSEALRLHSRPEAYLKLYLDFEGSVLIYGWGTVWWNRFGPANGSDFIITTPPYDVNGDPGSFSDLELRYIVSMWRAVAEDFSPFNVDVTTEKPDYSLFRRGHRIVIGGHPTWLNPPVNGIAVQDGFGHPGFGNPPAAAFVFSARLLGNPKAIADVISHEAGHTMGVRHDGVTTPKEEYYGGHPVPFDDPAGGGPRYGVSWGPIMGRAWAADVSQWSMGEYANASQRQDDLGVIGNRVGWVADDHGDTRGTATPVRVSASAGAAVVRGLINRPGDADVFSFHAPQGTLRVALALLPLMEPPFSYSNGTHAVPAPRIRSNLNAAVQVISESGAVLGAWSEPAGLLSGAWEVALPQPGRYFVSIVGVGSQVTSWGGQGFSNYGSVGQYKVSLGASWPDAPVTCRSVDAQLPQTRANASCGRVVLGAADLYESGAPVAVSPPLPGEWPLELDAVYTVTSLVGGAACTSRVRIRPCPPACRGDAGRVALRMPQAGGNCSRAVISGPEELFEAYGPYTINPPNTTFPFELPPGGAASFKVTGLGGLTCTTHVAAVPCAPVCGAGGAAAVDLPLPTGDCASAALSPGDVIDHMYNATMTPPLPNSLPPGNHEFTVTNAAGSCSLTLQVNACKAKYLRLELVSYEQTAPDRAGRWMVRNVKLRLVDETGAPVGGARVRLAWENLPPPAGAGGASAPSSVGAVPKLLAPKTRTAVASRSSRADARGVATSTSPRVAVGRLRLRIAGVTLRRAGAKGGPDYRWDPRPPHFASRDFPPPPGAAGGD